MLLFQPPCSEAYNPRLSFRSKSKEQLNERRAGLSSIEELLEAALVSPAGCVLTSGRGRCAVCRAGFQGEVVFAVLAIQDFEFGTLPWHLVIRVKFGTCVQNWDFLGQKFGT